MCVEDNQQRYRQTAIYLELGPVDAKEGWEMHLQAPSLPLATKLEPGLATYLAYLLWLEKSTLNFALVSDKSPSITYNSVQSSSYYWVVDRSLCVES